MKCLWADFLLFQPATERSAKESAHVVKMPGRAIHPVHVDVDLNVCT